MDHLRAALAYASAAIPVFPLAPRSKVPLIPASKGGRGLHDATTNLDQVRAWWTRTPNANIGLRTGMVFDVVDLDSEDAVDTLDEARAGREPLRGPVVQTAHGFHWYVKPTGLGNRAGILSGIDFRGRRGYVLGPPSVHPGGLTYRWVNPLREEIAPAPAWLLKLMTPDRTVNGSNELRVSSSPAYGRAALRRELERLSQAGEGTRNHELNRAAFALGRLVAAGELDEQETAAALIDQGQRIRLGITECERTVTSGLSAGMESSRGLVAGH